MKTKLTIPAWLKITSSKESQVESVAINRVQFRVGQTVECEVGQPVTVWTKKGRMDATVTELGLCVAGLNADGSKSVA